jgi:hypothetical protein
MVPLFQEIVRQGLSVIRAAHNVQVGEQPNLARGPAARDLLTPHGQRIVIEQTPGAAGGTGGRPTQPLERSGVYSILDASQQPIDKLAVNIDPSAGSTDLQTSAAVGSWLNASGPWTTIDAANLSTTLAADHAASPNRRRVKER